MSLITCLGLAAFCLGLRIIGSDYVDPNKSTSGKAGKTKPTPMTVEHPNL